MVFVARSRINRQQVNLKLAGTLDIRNRGPAFDVPHVGFNYFLGRFHSQSLSLNPRLIGMARSCANLCRL
jgi:hypothetical protein